MVKTLARQLPIYIRHYGLPQRSSILMIIVDYLKVDLNCKY